MPSAVAWVGDGLVPVDDAVVSAFDLGFRTGEGVFETFRAYGKHPFRLDAHLERAEAGTAVLDFQPPAREVLARAVRETARANAGEHDLGLRLTLTPGSVVPDSPFPGRRRGSPTLVVTAQPLDHDPSMYELGVRGAIIASVRELPEVKAVSYLSATLARRAAHRQGADEAILTGPDGAVLEGSYSNVFAVRDGRVVTPPLDAGILPGVTRAVVLEVAAAVGIPVDEKRLTSSDLLDADEAFLTATTREIVPLVAVDEHTIGEGQPGDVTRSLLEAYRAEVRREIRAG